MKKEIILPNKKQEHLQEIKDVMSVLLKRLKIDRKRSPVGSFFMSLGINNHKTKTWQYKHTKIVNKKIKRKLELLKEFLD